MNVFQELKRNTNHWLRKKLFFSKFFSLNLIAKYEWFDIFFDKERLKLALLRNQKKTSGALFICIHLHLLKEIQQKDYFHQEKVLINHNTNIERRCQVF